MESAEPRLFVAIPIPSSLQEELARRCGNLSRSLAFKKWVHPEDLHITLQFLGAVRDDLILSIAKALERTSRSTASFKLSIEGIGSFGAAASPRILWAGLNGDLTVLGELQQMVVTAMSPLGFPGEERPYRPHITLAKHFRGNDDDHPSEALRRFANGEWAQPLNWTVNEIVLFQTHLGKSPMYERLHAYPLKDDIRDGTCDK